MIFDELNYLGTRWKPGSKISYKYVNLGSLGLILSIDKYYIKIKWENGILDTTKKYNILKNYKIEV